MSDLLATLKGAGGLLLLFLFIWLPMGAIMGGQNRYSYRRNTTDGFAMAFVITAALFALAFLKSCF